MNVFVNFSKKFSFKHVNFGLFRKCRFNFSKKFLEKRLNLKDKIKRVNLNNEYKLEKVDELKIDINYKKNDEIKNKLMKKLNEKKENIRNKNKDNNFSKNDKIKKNYQNFRGSRNKNNPKNKTIDLK